MEVDDELRKLLESYAEPCAGDCDHSQCPLLRELHALRIKATLERARLAVKPIVDLERKGEEIGDLMNMRLDAAALAGTVQGVDENSVAFTAYNQAIEDAKAAIRGEKVDDPYAAAIFINAIARKCSPHVYATRVAEFYETHVGEGHVIVSYPVPTPAPKEEEAQDYKGRATRNFRWAYQLLLALAKRRLADANLNREDENDWPAGQEWHEMVGSSHSIFLRGAREEAKIPEDAFMGVIRSLEYDVDDLYEAATIPVSDCDPDD